MSTCLSDFELGRFHAGEMAEEQAVEVAGHLEQCMVCRSRSASLLGQQEAFLGRFRALAEDGPEFCRRPSAVKPSSDDLPARTAPLAVAGTTPDIPEQIGRYRVLRLIGEGGMGVVYEAQQEQPRRTVALKVIKPGYVSNEAIRRFELESQALGRLQHPGIAQVFEAGTAGDPPRPYFAMEFVAGQPLTTYCDLKRLGVRERLELIAHVADAVQHAHTKAIIHRDLKPANILVAEGDERGTKGPRDQGTKGSAETPPSIPAPKVLDFGVARLMDSDPQATMRTGAGVLVGTLAYMSPEQVAAKPDEVDTRSDVYSLSVMLYELLTGRLPYDMRHLSLPEVVRVISEQEPIRISAIDSLGKRSSRALRGDVETIVAKALEKDRERRYPSAAEFAADIRRYLSSEPIIARPASALYQLSKFARRHRGMVGGALATVVMLIVAIVGTSIGLVRARRAETGEREQRDAAETVVRFLNDDLLAAADRAERGGRADITVREALDAAASKAEAGELRGRPTVEYAVRTTIGKTYRSLGLLPEAEPHLRRALELCETLHGADSPETASCMSNLGSVLQARGALSEADALFTDALRIRRERFGNQHPDVARNMNKLGGLRQTQGRIDEAAELLHAALEIRRSLPNERKELAESLNSVGWILLQQNRLAEAEPLLREALDLTVKLHGPEYFRVAYVTVNLAGLLKDQGRTEEAEASYREALGIAQKALVDDHPTIAICLSKLAQLRLTAGYGDEAESLAQQALEIARRRLGPDHSSTATALFVLGSIRDQQGRHAEALEYLHEALEIDRRAHALPHPDVGASLFELAKIKRNFGRFAEAEAHLREAILIFEKVYGARHERVAACLTEIGSILQDQGRLQDAERAFRDSIAMQRSLFGDDSPKLAASLNNLGYLFHQQGRFADAEPLYRESAALHRKAHGDSHPDLAGNLNNWAFALVMLDRAEEAEPVVREALAIREKRLSPSDWRIASSRGVLGMALGRLGRFPEAEPLLLDAAGAMEALASTPPDRRRESIERVAELYSRWHGAEPDDGHDAKAAEWRAKLAEWQATTQPAGGGPGP